LCCEESSDTLGIGDGECVDDAGTGLYLYRAATLHEGADGDTGVEVRLSDITEVFCDALVTPVEVELTTGNVIHAAVKDDSGNITQASVTAALSAALKEAEGLEAETVAIPGLGYVDGGIEASESAAAVIAAVNDHSGEYLSKVLLVDIAKEVVSAFVVELEKRDEE